MPKSAHFESMCQKIRRRTRRAKRFIRSTKRSENTVALQSKNRFVCYRRPGRFFRTASSGRRAAIEEEERIVGARSLREHFTRREKVASTVLWLRLHGRATSRRYIPDKTYMLKPDRFCVVLRICSKKERLQRSYIIS